MTDIPDAAVQIMKRRLVSAPDLVEAMATDLHDAGLLHDPAEVAALRAVADAARAYADDVHGGGSRYSTHAVRLLNALDALLPAVPAPPQGEDDSEVWIPPRDDCMEYRPDKPCPRCGGLMFHHRTRRCGECGRRRPAGVPAGPQPADEDPAELEDLPTPVAQATPDLLVGPFVASWVADPVDDANDETSGQE